MSEPVIRAKIAAVLASVADIGRVHEYERYANTLEGLKALYHSEAHGQIRGWFVRRVRTVEHALSPIYSEQIHWRIQGVMALADADASELALDGLIESIRNTFRSNRTLDGTVQKQGLLGSNQQRGIQLDDFGPVMFAGVLCHGVRLSLITTTEGRTS